MRPKILDRTEAATLRQANAGKSLVLTNGCFDILHVGHVRYLEAARRLGDLLIVGLNGDGSVRQLKGPNRPVNSQGDRAEVLAALEAVNYVVIFGEERVTSLAREIRPDIYVKGGNYTLETLNLEEVEAMKEIGTRIELVPLVPGKSTTNLIHSLQAL